MEQAAAPAVPVITEGVKEVVKEVAKEAPVAAKSEAVKTITGPIAQKIASLKAVLTQYKWSTALGVAGVAFLMYCIFRFNCKDPKKECINRYSLSFKDLKLRSVEDINGLQEQIRYILKNIHYIVEDGIIGRAGNSSPSIRVDPETWKVNAKEYCPYQGFFGWIHAYSKPLVTTLKFPYEAGKIVLTGVAGVYLLANIDKIANAIETANLEKAVSDLGTVVMTASK